MLWIYFRLSAFNHSRRCWTKYIPPVTILLYVTCLSQTWHKFQKSDPVSPWSIRPLAIVLHPTIFRLRVYCNIVEVWRRNRYQFISITKIWLLINLFRVIFNNNKVHEWVICGMVLPTTDISVIKALYRLLMYCYVEWWGNVLHL